MSEPANLSELYFRAIHLTQGVNGEKMTLVIVAGKDAEGKSQIWADENSYYKTEHESPVIREALRAMAIREIPFYDAVDAIRSEWLNPDGTWFLNDEKELTAQLDRKFFTNSHS